MPIKTIPNYDKLDYFDIHTPDDGPSLSYCYHFYNKLSTEAKQYVLNIVKVDPFWHFIVSNIKKIYYLCGPELHDLITVVNRVHEYYLYNKLDANRFFVEKAKKKILLYCEKRGLTFCLDEIL